MDKSRLDKLLERLTALEIRVFGDQGAERVKRALVEQNIFSAKLIHVPSHYYDLALRDRAALLQANPSQLCKSIIFENTACEHHRLDDPTYSRFYCVIVQYEGKITT